MGAEQALQLAAGGAAARGQFLRRPRVLQLLLHQSYRLRQLLVVHLIAAGHLQALMLGRTAHLALHQLFGHRQRQLAAVASRQQGQRQVQPGHRAGGGGPLLGQEQLLAGRHLRVAFPEGRNRFPVQRHRFAAQQAGLGQDEAAGVYRPQGRSPALQPSQRRAQLRRVMAQRMEAADHEQTGARPGLRQRAVHHQRDAVAGRHRLAVHGQQSPAAGAGLKTVGDAEGFHQGGKADEGKLRQ